MKKAKIFEKYDQADIAEKVRIRTQCCKDGSHEGLGELASLRNYINCVAKPRAAELQPVVDAVAKEGDKPVKHPLRDDEIVPQLLAEYHAINAAVAEAEAAFEVLNA